MTGAEIYEMVTGIILIILVAILIWKAGKNVK